MNKEKDFFKTCFNTVAGLEVKNESQAIAKEVVLSEIENLQEENKKLTGAIQTYDILLKANTEENKKLKDNWNKLREYFNERIEVCDNRLSSPFCNFEKATKERLIFSQCLEKLTELEGSDSNE